jgi:hypothetical protein
MRALSAGTQEPLARSFSWCLPNTPTNVSDDGDEVLTSDYDCEHNAGLLRLDHHPDNGSNGAITMTVTTQVTYRHRGDGHNDEVTTSTMVMLTMATQ